MCRVLRVWRTGDFPRTDAERYLHVIRSPGDPPDVRPRGRGVRDPDGWKELRKKPPAWWYERFRLLLADKKPRTFNRMMLELAGYTADIAFEEVPDIALWAMVGEREIEHTIAVPILFRLHWPAGLVRCWRCVMPEARCVCPAPDPMVDPNGYARMYQQALGGKR